MPKRVLPQAPQQISPDRNGNPPEVRASGSLPEDYADLLSRIKLRIGVAQVRAVLAANREVLRLYWQTGRDIAARQEEQGWGASVIKRLAQDLAEAFPGIAGLSSRNLWRMRAFYLAYRIAPEVAALAGLEDEDQELPQAVAEIPWGHHVVLLERVKDPRERVWYARMALENGWSRSVLQLQMEGNLYQRQGKALNNFHQTLPSPQSDLAHETFKDPYLFDFLNLSSEMREREIEQSLIDHVQRFLLELGVGFAFVGRQVHLEVGGEDFYLDLLFYHLKLRCFAVVELKATPFRPEFIGKMNFYLSAVDEKLRHPDDQPSIGLLLCKSKNQVMVEYALRDLRKPVGVAQWETQLVASLPEDLRGSLPTIEELEAELGPGLPSPTGSSSTRSGS
ncbi:MAG TPA: PDDEXK nuclease domain-containing protein [Thermoanaerobaculia bacterium]|nr:PDDEXK nuclease domain-containing protein [Thermoanaerobaculia bacterium]